MKAIRRTSRIKALLKSGEPVAVESGGQVIGELWPPRRRHKKKVNFLARLRKTFGDWEQSDEDAAAGLRQCRGEA